MSARGLISIVRRGRREVSGPEGVQKKKITVNTKYFCSTMEAITKVYDMQAWNFDNWGVIFLGPR
jgi:hypothetical protein